MSPYEEILYIIRNAPGPIGSADIYDKCKSIETIGDVSSRLKQLLDKGKVVREGITTASKRKAFVYSLPTPDAAPAPAGKAGQTVALPLTGVRPPMDIPTLADPGISLQGTAGKTQRAKPVNPQADPIEDLLDRGTSVESLAEAILAKTREQLTKALPESAYVEGPLGAPIHIHIHIEQVDFHLGGL